MSVTLSMRRGFEQIARGIYRLLLSWWQLTYVSAVILVHVLSASTYTRAKRAVLSQHMYRNTASILLGFTLVCALIALVITHIVLVTSKTYGLSQYALQVVIRVLVLELIPLTATLFVALRCTIPDGAELVMMQHDSHLGGPAGKGFTRYRDAVMPRVIAGIFAGITLAALSSAVVLIVAYLTHFGFSVAGFTAFTRSFGQVFAPAVTLIFVLKTLIFSLTVALIPMASAVVELTSTPSASSRTSAEMRGLVRMFTLVLLVEVLSLVGNYY